MGNETSAERKQRKQRKEVIDQLVKFDYAKTDILNAMRVINQPEDIWEVMKYLEEQKDKEYNRTMRANIDEIEKAEEKKQIKEDKQLSREWNTNQNNLTLLKEYSELPKDKLIDLCKEKDIESDGSKNEIIARLLKDNEFQIAAPSGTSKKND